MNQDTCPYQGKEGHEHKDDTEALACFLRWKKYRDWQNWPTPGKTGRTPHGEPNLSN